MLRFLKTQWLNRRRLRALKSVSDAQFKALLQLAATNYRSPWRAYDYLVVDIETTGLNPQTDHMVSIGWVPISAGRIQLHGAREYRVRTSAQVSDSATIHGLRQQDIATGISVTEALQHLVVALHRHVLVVHYSGLDKQLLDNLCKDHYGVKLEVPVVDTLELSRNILKSKQLVPSDFSLPSLCERMNLTQPIQHQALSDALATACSIC